MRAAFRCLCLALALGAVLSAAVTGRAAAQDQERQQAAQPEPDPAPQARPDYSAWRNLAGTVESTLETDDASNDELEQLRSEVAAWRDRFLAAQSINRPRIDTLRSQIDRLGAPPPEGETEPEALASQRSELNAELEDLLAPRQAADSAYTRADGLIAQIDRVIRERQAAELLTLGPSPLNPALWPEAMLALRTSVRATAGEVVDRWSTPEGRAALRDEAPVEVMFLAIAFALMLRGRYWMEQLTLLIQDRVHAVGRGVLIFVVSLGQVAVPAAGILALIAALQTSALLGLRGTALLDDIAATGIGFYVAHWLGARVFPRRESFATVLNLSEASRAEGRLYAGGLGLALGLGLILAELTGVPEHDEATRAVILFPVFVVLGVLLFRMGQLMRRGTAQDIGEGQTPGFRDQVAFLLGRAAMILGTVGPILAAVGYFAAARALLGPATLSLGLIATLVVLHLLARDIYALVTRKNEQAVAEALTPVLVSMALGLAAIPVFALIWGARVADLAEIWARFREGFALGETRISPADFLTFLVIFVIGLVLTRLLQATLKSTVLPRTQLDTGGRNAIAAGVGYLGVFLAAILAVTATGIDLSSLAIVAGALSVGIGFGLQAIVSNFVSGIILLIERPISEGDWIEVNGKTGYVRDISVRSTRIETFDRTDVIVPNADFISGTVTNWTHGKLTGRVIVPVGVAHGSDTRQVERVLQEIAEAHPMVALNPPPVIFFIGFGNDSLNFEIRAILRDVNWILSVASDMNHEIARRFAEEDIDIPFPQRDVWLRTPDIPREGSATARQGPRRPEPRDTSAHLTDSDVAPDAEGDPR